MSGLKFRQTKQKWGTVYNDTCTLEVGTQRAFIVLSGSIKDALRKISGVNCMSPLFYLASIYLSVLKHATRYFETTNFNRLWLTQIFLYRFKFGDLPAMSTALRQTHAHL